MARTHDDIGAIIGADRAADIVWEHPALATLSVPARLIYTCLIDGASPEARDTISGVEIVWRNRSVLRSAPASLDPVVRNRRETSEAICRAVEELIDQGLVVLLDESSLTGGWVRKPWQSDPS
jgi:hypothetical protein